MIDPTIIEFAAVKKPDGQVAILLTGEGPVLPPVAQELDKQSGGAISRAIAIAGFKGKAKKSFEMIAPAGLKFDRLLVAGTGKAAEHTATDWLNLGGALGARLTALKSGTVSILVEQGGNGLAAGEEAANLALGIVLRSYKFKKYKTKKPENGEGADADENGLSKIKICCASPDEAAAQFAQLRATGEGVILARDLVNEPANVLGPVEFAARIRALQEHGVEVEILEEAKLQSLKMGALLGVGQGSERPSCVAVMRWTGAKNKRAKPACFVGKGVCFDSGGISIKPGQGMEDMKGDMGGAACVTGLMLALAKRKAPVNAVGVVGLVENMPDGRAQRPGDIVTSMSGQTIEVLNTDAEGRLVLADLLTFVQEYIRPKFAVTLATLTGAIIIALGKEHAGLFSNDDQLAAKLIEAGKATDEKVWRLPLGPKYDKLLDSPIADMKNIGGRDAGSITAAQFLQRFIVDDLPWAHIDIAGTAMGSPQTDINQSWGSGFGVRLLEKLVEKG